MKSDRMRITPETLPGKTTGQYARLEPFTAEQKHIMNGDTEKISGGEIYNCSSNKHK